LIYRWVLVLSMSTCSLLVPGSYILENLSLTI